jgi:hypothetical protein
MGMIGRCSRNGVGGISVLVARTAWGSELDDSSAFFSFSCSAIRCTRRLCSACEPRASMAMIGLVMIPSKNPYTHLMICPQSPRGPVSQPWSVFQALPDLGALACTHLRIPAIPHIIHPINRPQDHYEQTPTRKPYHYPQPHPLESRPSQPLGKPLDPGVEQHIILCPLKDEPHQHGPVIVDCASRPGRRGGGG